MTHYLFIIDGISNPPVSSPARRGTRDAVQPRSILSTDDPNIASDSEDKESFYGNIERRRIFSSLGLNQQPSTVITSTSPFQFYLIFENCHV